MRVMAIIDRIRLATSSDLTLGTLLERLADVHGDRQIVEEHGTGLKLTFREAADKVARMAGGIRKQIGPGDRVVIATENGYGLFLLCMAVCRAGGVAVPVNPKMRDEEVKHVIDDSGAKLVLKSEEEVDDEPVDAADADPDDLAAIFYTSGTTGKPKGAQLTHRALIGAGSMMAAFPVELRRDEAVSGMPVAHIAGFSIVLI